MTEADFLKTYDAGMFAPYAVTVDLVLFSVIEGRLVTLVKRRDQHPFQGKWALPGGFVQPDEDLEAAAARVLLTKTPIEDVWLEQLYTFGAPDRDPRMRIISVAYFALLPEAVFQAALEQDADMSCAVVALAGDAAQVRLVEGEALELAFDHSDMIAVAVKRLRGKIDYTPIALALLPDRFTLRELQEIHEAILDTQFNKPAFRRRILDAGMIEGTGEREPSGGAYRPAELYQRKPQA